MLGLTNDLIQSLFSRPAPKNKSGPRILWHYLAIFTVAIFITLSTLISCHKDAPHSVTLTWDVSADPKASVVGYNVYRRTLPDGQFVKLADRIQKPPYEDRLVLTGREYVYAVTALDRSGHESHFSVEARADIP